MTHPHATDTEEAPPPGSSRARLHQIIFESDTRAGRAFAELKAEMARMIAAEALART